MSSFDTLYGADPVTGKLPSTGDTDASESVQEVKEEIAVVQLLEGMGRELWVILVAVLFLLAMINHHHNQQLLKNQEKMVKVGMLETDLRILQKTGKEYGFSNDDDLRNLLDDLLDQVTGFAKTLGGNMKPEEFEKWYKDTKTKVDQVGKKIDKPPIFELADQKEFKFASGQMEARNQAAFINKLNSKVIPDLIQLADKYNPKVVKITGYTDGSPNLFSNPNEVLSRFKRDRFGRLMSSFDADFALWISGKINSPPKAITNAELGLGRAGYVMRLLQDDPRIASKGLKIIPASGGEVTNLDYSINTSKRPNSSLRRITIELILDKVQRQR